MKTVVNVHAAKTGFSRLLDRAEAGEEIVIARGNKPVARLVPLRGGRAARAPGLLKGRVHIAEDFDAPLPPHVLSSFELGAIEPPVRARRRK